MCYNCGVNPGEITIYRNTECPVCGKDLKVCLNCEYFDRDSHWQCRENIPEEVRDKDRSNFCDYFRYSRKVDSKADGDFKKQINEAKSDFLKLFEDE